MSIHEVEAALLEDRLKNKWMETPGHCRPTAIRMYEVAKAADRTEPKTVIDFLAFPKAQESEATHYALQVVSPETTLIFNPCPTNSFPQYIGSAEDAPGLLQFMVVVPEVL